MDKLKIDQVALQSGLTKRTIRYYEEIGLLPPPQRSERGIRYYTQDHVQMLIKIKDIKNALGLSLEELQKFISIDHTIEAQREDYKKSVKQNEQKERLMEIISNLDTEINLIEQKILTIEQVRRDLINMKRRAQALVDSISSNEILNYRTN